jgi:predicted nucleotidyltransferase
MTIRHYAIEIIRDHQRDLANLGVLHAAIFGSVARGEDRENSDVDIMVEVDPAVVSGIFALGRIQSRLETWMGRPVDVARRDRLRPGVATEAERDAVYAF